MKFSTKRYLKDRAASTERSKKGELELLENKNSSNVMIKEAITEFKAILHPLHTKTLNCNYKTVTDGCSLPYIKRSTVICGACTSKEM